ncbi:MAG: hypothetical protein AUH42_02490 [Gemmatimonadetes bacterium 13_1_40CM_70_11]|nr:MAG: hypothetical protein AUH42_02490 [Gemmatimonadetes bacterium 13_1_40CM_70_11]
MSRPFAGPLALVAAVCGASLSRAGATAQETIHRTASISGTVVAAESGELLPFSVVALLPGFSPRFTDQTGTFSFAGLAPGRYRLLARQIGYHPLDTVFAVGDSVPGLRIALSHVAIQLPPVTVTGRTTCVASGTAAAPELAAVFEQLLENARRFQLLADSFPHRFRIERIFTTVDRLGRDEVSQVDTFERESTFRWPYRPGRIVGPASGPLNNDRLVRLPSLPDFADSTFVHAHCFRLVGQDTLAGSTFIRLDFAPVATLRATDVEGAAYMDPTSYQVRYTTVRLTRPEREMPGVAAMAATIHFSEIAPGILLHDHVRSVETFASSHTPTERIEEQRLLGVHFLRPLMRTQ